MKKFLCFALVLCLALAPVGVFADEYDNGENGYDAEDYLVDDEATDAEAYENDEATDAEENENGAEAVAEEATPEEIVAVAADLGQTWTFGMDDDTAEGFSFVYYVDGTRSLATYADGLWVSAAEGAEDWAVDTQNGYVTLVEGLDAVILWYAKADGLFDVTLSFLGNRSMGSVLLNGEIEVEKLSASEDFNIGFELAEGDELSFVTSGTGTASWKIVIREILAEEAAEEVTEEVEEVELPVEEPAEEVVVPVEEPAVDPLAGVPVRYVDGVQFVAFRLFANALGYYTLSWDGATGTITVVDVVSFTLAEAGGFNDNGTVYVPMAFATSLFQ